MKFASLIMVVPTSVSECKSRGNNKFYKMEELPNGFFRATYGRVGTAGQKKEYPMSKWDSTLDSKLRKGYKDNTNLVTNSQVLSSSAVQDMNEEFKQIRIKCVRDLIERLISSSNKVVTQNYKNAEVVTSINDFK